MKNHLTLLFAAVAMTSFSAAAESEPGVHLEMEHSEHTFHRHHVGLFFGGSTRFENDHDTVTGIAIGLDYDYRFTKRWGVGGVIEGVAFSENHRDLGFAVPISFHPTERLKLSAGPGFEIEGGHAEFLARFSVSYAIPIWKFTLSPELAVDVLDQKQVFMYGFSFGGGF